MATFTMTVKSTPGKTSTPYKIDEKDDECVTYKTIRVPIPNGAGSVHVQVLYSGLAGGTSGSYTINTQTDITIILEARKDLVTPSNNTGFSSAYLRISLSASDPVYFSEGITRQHRIDPVTGQALKC